MSEWQHCDLRVVTYGRCSSKPTEYITETINMDAIPEWIKGRLVYLTKLFVIYIE